MILETDLRSDEEQASIVEMEAFELNSIYWDRIAHGAPCRRLRD